MPACLLCMTAFFFDTHYTFEVQFVSYYHFPRAPLIASGEATGCSSQASHDQKFSPQYMH
jgi:hypothetical protein